MGFVTAVRTCFRKYTVFRGRAGPAEFWYFALFIVLGEGVLSVVDRALFGPGADHLEIVFALAVLPAALAAAARRLTDTGRSPWWLLILAVPIAGTLILIFWLAMPGEEEQAPPAGA